MDNPELRQFSSFINELRNGAVNEELSEKMASVVKECEKTQKAGSVTLKVNLTPNKGNGTMIVSAVVDGKPPKHDPPANIFYVDSSFNLRREDPRQMNIGDLKTAGDETASQSKTS